MFVNCTILKYVITFTSPFFYSKNSQIDILVRLVKILKIIKNTNVQQNICFIQLQTYKKGGEITI